MLFLNINSSIYFQIVPATLKRQARQDPRGPRTTPGGRPEGGRSGEDRATYRRAPGAPGADKKAEVGAGTAELDFVSILRNYYFHKRVLNNFFFYNSHKNVIPINVLCFV